MKFNAAKLLSDAEAKELFDLGLKAMPMQWVESDKNYHKRRDNKIVEMLLKSRLVGCGNFEDTPGLRTDSPAGDVDAHNLVCSWCACEVQILPMHTYKGRRSTALFYIEYHAEASRNVVFRKAL